jgi:hypothetical protein
MGQRRGVLGVVSSPGETWWWATSLAALRDHQGRQLLERAAMGGDRGNELDLVFTREDGSPIHP